LPCLAFGNFVVALYRKNMHFKFFAQKAHTKDQFCVSISRLLHPSPNIFEKW
jgi:hypothetical protein